MAAAVRAAWTAVASQGHVQFVRGVRCRLWSAEAAQKDSLDGTCASQGYTERTGAQTSSYPMIGDTVVMTYDKPALAVEATCSCGESELRIRKFAKAAQKGLVDGTCACQGYTLQMRMQTKSDRIIGDIILTA